MIYLTNSIRIECVECSIKANVSAGTLLVRRLLALSLLLQLEPLECRLEFLFTLQDLAYQLIKGATSALKCLSTSLYVWNSNLLCHLGRSLFLHLPILLQIYFVSNQQQVYFGNICLVADFLDPKVYHFEWFFILEKDTLYTPIVTCKGSILNPL